MKEIYLLLDNIRSLYNVGSIFRTAEGLGVKKIFLCGVSGIERINNKIFLHTKVLKTALEGINIPWEFEANTENLIRKLKAKNIQIVIAERVNNSTRYTDVKYDYPLCLVMGNEIKGISETIIKLADLIVEIPMLGQGKSLNVAVCAGIIVSEIVRQKIVDRR